MQKKTGFWLWGFALAALLKIGANAASNKLVAWITGPLLMPLLAIWFALVTRGSRRFLRQTLVTGLIFATVGDTMMMFSGSEYGALFFLLGLCAFLCTHLCYIGGFLKEANLKNGFLSKQPFWVAPFALFLGLFLTWLWPGLPRGLHIPVVVYASAISIMALSVVNGKGHFSPAVFREALAGALLFMLSDCMIAADKFGHPFPGASVAIIATYILGQWLIVHAVSKHIRHTT